MVTIQALLMGLVVATAPEMTAEDPSKRVADQAALKPLAGLVGDWRGTGQPQRGSARGAWTETAGWSWKLAKDSAALELKIEKGKHLKEASLRPGSSPGAYLLDATLADGASRKFVGKIGARNALVLSPETPVEDGLARVTITPLHDTRFLMLLESAAPGGGYSRLGEVGYTRQGVAFAAGDSAPVCIVTEGRGTIPVSYKGKTYHVCCSGCKELFEDDPEAVLAEAKERAKGK